MNSLTLFSLIAGILELSVPVYGLLLIRRFGRRNMGRFFGAAFCLLALLNVVQWLNASAIGPANLRLIIVFASVLLLIGMGHLQGLYTLRRQSECEGEKLSANWQLTLKEKTAELASTNQQLLEQVARHREVEQALRQSEQQYRFLFTQSPQPQWIFDLRSLRLLAVNGAALGLFGYALEEFMALSARRLLQPEAAGLFLRDAAKPCPKAQSRGRWGFCTKGGSRIEAEIGAVDLNYDGCPARLIVLSPVIEHRTVAPQARQVTKIETVYEPRCNIPQAILRTASLPGIQLEVVRHKSPEPSPVAAPHQNAPAEIRSTAPACELISLPAGNSDPVKSPAPRLSDISRTVSRKQPELPRPQVTPVRPKPSPPRRSTSGKETILLVEPESKSRGLARFALSRQGYRVIETDCASTVLALWESESTNVDVLLTDVSLPEGTSGPTLVGQLRQTKPELKVLYTSAATETEIEAELMNQNVLLKPYSPDKLLEAVKNCLVSQEEVSCASV